MIRMCILILLFITTVLSFPRYRSLIPNGFNVTNPCPHQTGIWNGVGHFLTQGSGAQNQFGLDFAAARHKWTPALCAADSDDDGDSNGVELGDPHCTWVKGDDSILHNNRKITHPGYCDNHTPECTFKNRDFVC